MASQAYAEDKKALECLEDPAGADKFIGMVAPCITLFRLSPQCKCTIRHLQPGWDILEPAGMLESVSTAPLIKRPVRTPAVA